MNGVCSMFVHKYTCALMHLVEMNVDNKSLYGTLFLSVYKLY